MTGTGMNTGGVTYKTGIVAASKPGFARVRFDDIDGLVTQWLPVIHHKTQNDKAVFTLDVGEQVACLMDMHMEDGCIVGAIYSQADAAPVTSPDKYRMQFSDGGSFEYDRASGAMNIVCKGTATLDAQGAVLVKTPATVTIDAPNTTITGNLLVQKTITGQLGLAVSGSAPGAGGAAATISGTVQVQGGDVRADTVSLKNHTHGGVQGGGSNTAPPNA